MAEPITITIENPKSLAYRVLLRFVRGFVAGGLAAMVLVAPLAGLSLTDLRFWILALIGAFMTGGLQAVGKWIRE